jgi:transposase InsO family protein
VPDPAPGPIPDRVERRFDRGGLNKVWTSDITYLDTGDGWLYLCVVRDGSSRRAIGWAVDDHLRADLVDQALTMAAVLRGVLPEKVIFHTDRGTQYTCTQIADLCSDLGCSNRWAGPGSAGTMPPPNRSGPPENRVLRPAELAHQSRSQTSHRTLVNRHGFRAALMRAASAV